MERESPSEEEKEGEEELISPICPSTFHIQHPHPRGISGISPQRRYLALLLFPLIIILLILYLSSNFNSILSTDSSSLSVSPTSNHTIQKLQALDLLNQQKLELLRLWNLSINSNPNFNLTGAFLKSALLTQISLNKQIQHLLLSSGSDNYNNNNNNTTGIGFLSINRCQKIEIKLDRKTINWVPAENKYLFAICVSGQMSNRLICLEKHMFFAAMLNRVLVIPSDKVDFRYDRVLDIEHINNCIGRKVVVTFDEFAKKGHLRIDKFVCYFSLPQPCFIDDGHVKKLESLGVSMSKLESVWVEDVKDPSKRTMGEVVSRFSAEEEVVAVGDVFFADVEREMVMQPGGPLAHKCKTLVEPSRLIMLTAQRFVQTFLGEGFIALHFRRHGFLKFCNAKKPSCFFPVPQAANCISRLVEKANTPVIYLSTDAAESETNLLQSLIVLNGKTVPLVKRPARNFAEKWDALLYRNHIEGDPQVEAMLDKAICAMSSVFIGTSGSTFTEDILRLRKDWGTASVCDEYLCHGEVPNFIADNE